MSEAVETITAEEAERATWAAVREVDREVQERLKGAPGAYLRVVQIGPEQFIETMEAVPHKPRRSSRPIDSDGEPCRVSQVLKLAASIANRIAGPNEERREAANATALDALAWADSHYDPTRGKWPAFAGSVVAVRVRSALADREKRRGRGPDIGRLPDDDSADNVPAARVIDDPDFRLDLAALNPESRRIVEAVVFGGENLAEIGRGMGLDYRTIRARINEAYQVLSGNMGLPM